MFDYKKFDLHVILDSEFSKTCTIYESKGNSGTDYTLKRYVSIPDSKFKNNWVQDKESVPDIVEKISFSYMCKNCTQMNNSG